MSAQLETQPERHYQDYSTERKAEVLALVAANGGNILQTARDTGIPHQTIRLWTANPERFSSLQNEKRITLADKLQNIAHNCADLLLEPERMAKAEIREIVGAMSQSIEKYNLINGLPTSIHTEVERQELVVILESALNAGQTNQSDVINVKPVDSTG